MISWTRPHWAAATAATLALAGCSASLPYELVCAGNGEDRLAERECIAVAEAAIAALDSAGEAALVAVQAYRGCPPGASCGLRLREVMPRPLSALVGVRMAGGTSAMFVVADVGARQLEAAPVIGYHPDEFIDGVARRRGTLRP